GRYHPCCSRRCVALFVSPRCSSCLASVTMSRYLGLANGSWSYCTSIYPSPVPSSDVFSATTQLAVSCGAPGPLLGGPHGQGVAISPGHLGPRHWPVQHLIAVAAFLAAVGSPFLRWQESPIPAQAAAPRGDQIH